MQIGLQRIQALEVLNVPKGDIVYRASLQTHCLVLLSLSSFLDKVHALLHIHRWQSTVAEIVFLFNHSANCIPLGTRRRSLWKFTRSALSKNGHDQGCPKLTYNGKCTPHEIPGQSLYFYRLVMSRFSLGLEKGWAAGDAHRLLHASSSQ